MARDCRCGGECDKMPQHIALDVALWPIVPVFALPLCQCSKPGAGWAPIISNCSVLASAADLVMNMETYNAASYTGASFVTNTFYVFYIWVIWIGAGIGSGDCVDTYPIRPLWPLGAQGGYSSLGRVSTTRPSQGPSWVSVSAAGSRRAMVEHLLTLLNVITNFTFIPLPLSSGGPWPAFATRAGLVADGKIRLWPLK